MNASRTARLHRRAFTLVETLLVLSIVVGFFAIAAMGMKKSWQGQELRASALQLSADLTLASQTAVRLGQPVQVRFYKFMDPAIASPTPQFRAYQLLQRHHLTRLVQPLYEVQRFSATTIMSGYERFSSIAAKPMGFTDYDPSVGIGTYEYVAIEFRPDGSTSLDPAARDPWSITLTTIQAADLNNPGSTPKIYETITIDPRTGTPRLW